MPCRANNRFFNPRPSRDAPGRLGKLGLLVNELRGRVFPAFPIDVELPRPVKLGFRLLLAGDPGGLGAGVPVALIIGLGAVSGGDTQNMSDTRSSSVFQCWTQRRYSMGIFGFGGACRSTILQRDMYDSKYGPRQNVHAWAEAR